MMDDFLWEVIFCTFAMCLSQVIMLLQFLHELCTAVAVWLELYTDKLHLFAVLYKVHILKIVFQDIYLPS